MPDLDNLMNDLNTMEGAMNNLAHRFPSIVGKESVDIIQANFDKQGYESGQSFSKWQKRSPNTDKAYDYNRTKKYKTQNRGNKSTYKNPYKGSVYSSKSPILRQTGNLRDSISYRVSGFNIKIGVFPKFITINGKVHNAVAYAQIHNEGLQFKAWGKHLKKMPKRQFMPKPTEVANPKIIKAVKEKWEFEEKKIMAKFNAL